MLVALGVTGGIGAYKAVEVARGLQKRGHEVVAVMTHSATRFVGPVTFEAITRRPVITDQFAEGMNADIEHIAIASTIDLLLIAPATANIIGKLANGIADDFLSTLYTATRAPVLIAPAMNSQMFAHPAVRKNLVTLVVGPTDLEPPAVREVVRVRTATEMHQAVMSRASEMHVVIMAAAVADYMPERAPQKVPKGAETLTMILHKTPDILGDLGHRRLASGRGPALIGFAAETQDVVARAIEKRAKKHVDLIVANDVARTDAGFDVDTNAVTIVTADGAESLPLQSKLHVAGEILSRVERLLSGSRSAESASPVRG